VLRTKSLRTHPAFAVDQLPLLDEEHMLRIRHLAGAFLASTYLTPAVFAQSGGAVATPPIRSTLDANGVDVVLGALVKSQTDVSIGPASGGLAFTRTLSGGGWLNPYFGTVKGSSPHVLVSIGGQTEGFSVTAGGGWTSDQGSANTLASDGSGGYIYTLADGTVANLEYVRNALYQHSQYSATLTHLTYPSGLQLVMTYTFSSYCELQNGCQSPQVNAMRLQSVRSNTGYGLQFIYAYNPTTSPFNETQSNNYFQVTKIIAFNTSVESCDPTATSCTFTNSWPTAQYTANAADVTDPLGRITHFTYTGGLLTGIRRPSSATINTTIAYDSSNRVHTYSDGAGTWTYTYVDSGTTRTTTVTDPYSHTRTIVSDQTLVVPTSITDELSHTTTYAHDTMGRTTQVTMPEGNYTTYAYDTRGNVTTVTSVAKSGSGLANIVTSANYSTTCSNPVTCNKPTYTIDANGKETDYTYDPTHGGVLTVTLPAPTTGAVRPQTRYTYTAMNAWLLSGGSHYAATPAIYELTGVSSCRTTASCTGNLDEVKSTTSYQTGSASVGTNLLALSQSSGAGDGSLTATSSATYDIFSNVYTTTDPLGHVTRYRFDADREVVGIVGPDPDGSGALKYRAVRSTYNLDGLPIVVEKGTVPSQSDSDWANFATLQQVSSAYDAEARKIQDSATAGGTTYAVAQYSYDNMSRPDCTAIRMNPSTYSSLPSSACTAATAGGYGPDRIRRNGYSAASQLTSVIDAYGVTSQQRSTATYTYNPNGTTATLADAKNNLTTEVYDGFDRLSKTEYPSPTTPGNSNTADYQQRGYDPNGNITSNRLRDGTSIISGYDALNRLSGRTLPSPEHGVTYAYDNIGHPTTITGASTLTYGWDALGRMTIETQAYGSVAYLYDLANRRTRLTWQDGTYLTYDYDNVDEMTAVHENGGGSLASFTYDDLGERKTRTLANGTSTTYGYDPVSRLTSLALAGGTNANTATLSNYSPAGELGGRANSNDAFAWTAGVTASRAYTINGLNQFATVAGATQGYDGRGNLTSSGGTTYAYTSENLLKTVSGGFTLAYDPIGRLHEYDVPAATRFVYDGGMISEELNSSGTVLRRYAFGPAGDEPIVWYEGAGTTNKRYMDQDERGSVTRITDGSGNTIAVNSYDEYGIPGATNQGRFGYTGQAWLSEVGLAYYKARIYSPTLGRFMQADPIGYGDGPNWYNYAHSNPINGGDPGGTQDQYVPTGTHIPIEESSAPGDSGNADSYAQGAIDAGQTGGSIAGAWNFGREEDVFQESLLAQQPGYWAGTHPTDADNNANGTSVINVVARWRWVPDASVILSGASSIASGIQYGSGRTTAGWLRGVRYYTNGWLGNQYVKTISIAKVAGAISRIATIGSFLSDTISVFDGNISPTKYSINVTFDAAGYFGGPLGAAAGGYYYTVDTFYPGGWPGYFKDVNSGLAKSADGAGYIAD
jgi:RHS repeat-associated protein